MNLQQQLVKELKACFSLKKGENASEKYAPLLLLVFWGAATAFIALTGMPGGEAFVTAYGLLTAVAAWYLKGLGVKLGAD